MSYIWPGGEAILVESDLAGQPVAFTRRGQVHHVEAIAKYWRIDYGWWRSHVWRDHYKLVTTDGLLVIIYQDLNNQAWFFLRSLD